MLKFFLRVFCFRCSRTAKGGTSNLFLLMQFASLICFIISGSKFTNSSPVSGERTSKDACRPGLASSTWKQGMMVCCSQGRGKKSGFCLVCVSSILYPFHPALMVKYLILNQNSCEPVVIPNDLLSLRCGKDASVLCGYKKDKSILYIVHVSRQ